MAMKPTYKDLQKRIKKLEKESARLRRVEQALELERSQLLSIFDSFGESIYVSDPKTYEILFVNRSLRKAFGKEVVGGMCYREFQALDAPCPFCTNEIILRQKQETYRWEHHNPVLGRTFAINDRIIRWPDGRDVRLELAIDVTERKESEKRLNYRGEFERIIFQVSTGFIEPGGLDGRINTALKMISEFFEADRGYLFQIRDDGRTIDNTHEWCGEGVTSEIANSRGILADTELPWFWKVMLARESFHVPDVMALPPAAALEKALFQAQGIQSLAVAPIHAGPKLIGFIGFDSVQKKRTWSEDVLAMLKLTGEIIGRVLDRRRAEEELRSLKEFNENIVQKVTEGIVLTDSQGRVEFVNPAVTTMLGYSESELVGQSWLTLVPAEQKAIGLAADARRVAGRSDRYELTFQRKDGTPKAILVSGSPRIAKQSGASIGTMAVFTDLTESKRAEVALRESEKRYRTILESIAERYYEVDLAGNLTFFNDSVCELLGYSRNELTGMNDRQYTDEIGAAELFRAFNEVYRTGKPAKGFGWEIIRRDGARRFIEASISLVRDDERNPIGFRGIVRDATERKRAEEEQEKLQAQLNQAQKMESVGRLAGGVAHDFNNMLQAILGHTELALIQVPSGQALFGDLQQIKKAAERSADLVRQLLAFARKQTISPRVLDLNDTVEGMLKMLRRLIGEDIDLVWHPGHGLWSVKVDPGQIDQILANLAVNARDAIAGVGKVTIETGNVTLDEAYCGERAGFVPGEYVLLAVSDTGVGMGKEILDHLFEPFFTTKEVGKGTGLGLATVYGIVKQNEGFINVYSEPGHGTTIKIYLPPHKAKVERAHREAAGESAARGHETILLVEDEPAILDMTRTMLERLGYVVVGARRPGEAIRLAGEHGGEIHLLMTDVVMPEMNGRDLAKNLMHLYPDMKRLFMSGYTANVIAHHGVLDEGVQFIQKPFSMKDLAAKVREALDGR